MGVASITGQVLAIRELMYALRGNELALAVSLGVWLVSVGAASSFGGRVFSEKRSKQGRAGLERLVPLWLSIIATALPLVVLLPRLALPLMGFMSGELVPAWAAMVLIFATLVILTPFIGTLFPLCVIVSDGGTASAARVYALEALGYFTAGLALTFLAAGRLSPLETAALLGALLCAASLWFVFKGRQNGGGPAYAVAVYAALALAACAVLYHWSGQTELRSLNVSRAAGGVVDARWSRYGVVTVSELSRQYSVYENGAYAFSVPEPSSVQKDANMEMLAHPDPSDVLMVGGGGGMVREALRHPLSRLEYVELDPVMIEVYSELAGPIDDPRLNVRHMDGRRFIKSKRSACDLIMINLSEPTTASVNRYYTVEFFEEAKAALRPGGVLALSLPSSEGYIGGEKAALLGSVLVTLREAFPHVGVTPGDTALFLASETEPVERLDPETLEARYKARGVRAEGFGVEDIAFTLMPGEREMVMERIEAAGGFVNRDFRPLAYLYSLGVWGEMAGLPMFERISSLVSAGPRLVYWFAAPVVAVFLAVLIFRRGSRPAGAFYAVAATGFAGMTIEVSSLLAYQSYYGYLYDMLGALMASFMLGLYAGGSFGRRLVHTGRFRPWMVVAVDLLVTCAAAGLFALAMSPPGAGFGAAVFCLILVTGFLTGSEYPLSLELASVGREEQKKEAYPGILYGLDLVGAGFGAVLAGLVLVPLLGIAYAALTVVILKISTAVVLTVAAGGKIAPR